MSAVVTEAYSGGTLQSRDRVEYDYDDSGLRVRSSESSDADLNGSFETAEEKKGTQLFSVLRAISTN